MPKLLKMPTPKQHRTPAINTSLQPAQVIVMDSGLPDDDEETRVKIDRSLQIGDACPRRPAKTENRLDLRTGFALCKANTDAGGKRVGSVQADFLTGG